MTSPATRQTDDLPPTPRTRAVDKEVWVGLFVLASVAAILIALFTLTDASMFRGRYVVTTRIDDARGVRKGDPVVLRGVNIGRVKKFNLVPTGSVDMLLEIEGEFKVPADSHVEIKSSSLIQGMAVIVVPGTSAQTLKQGDAISGRGAAGPNIMDQASDVAAQAKTSLQRVDSLLSDTTIKNVQEGSGQLKVALKELTTTVETLRKDMAVLMPSLERSAASVEKTVSRPEIERSIARLDSLTTRSDELLESFKRSAASLDAFTARLEKGDGSLGKLSKDEELYKNLNESIRSLNKTATELATLTEDIRKNPKKYFKFSVF